jgi:hypothetical protein
VNADPGDGAVGEPKASGAGAGEAADADEPAAA